MSKHFVNDAISLTKSARSYDDDGRLKVASMPITKANVNEYLGAEIPDNDKLGLKPDKLYKLYRHPEELKKALSQFDSIPIMDNHHYQTAASPSKSNIIGSLGSNATFVHPYVKNSAVFWDGDAIKRIEDGTQKELSATYGFKPEMRSGITPEGHEYDGVMRNIKVNHLALVPRGRAGSDVHVSDSALDDENTNLNNNNNNNDIDNMADNTTNITSLDDIIYAIQSGFAGDCTQDQIRAVLSKAIAELNNGAGGDDVVSDDDLTEKDKKDDIEGEKKAQETLKKEEKVEDDAKEDEDDIASFLKEKGLADKDSNDILERIKRLNERESGDKVEDKDDKKVSDAISKAVADALAKRDEADSARDEVRKLGINAPVSDSAESVYLYGLKNSGYKESDLKGVNLAGLKLLAGQAIKSKSSKHVSDSALKPKVDFKPVKPNKI